MAELEGNNTSPMKYSCILFSVDYKIAPGLPFIVWIIKK